MMDSFLRSEILLLEDDQAPIYRCVVAAPAQSVTPDLMNRMLTLSGGIPFVAITEARANEFLLGEMVETTRKAHASQKRESAFRATVSVEAREGVHSGISSADRARTVSLLGMQTPDPSQLVKPGHIFPVIAKNGGVLVRSAIPEALIDIATGSRFSDATLFLDILDSSGDLAKRDFVLDMAKLHNLPLLSISDVVRERLIKAPLVERIAETRLPLATGESFRGVAYRSVLDGGEHLAVIKGEIKSDEPCLVRVQVEDRFSDIFGGVDKDTRVSITSTLKLIEDHSCGVLLYLRKDSSHESRRISGASMREYGLGARILRDLGVTKINLISSTTPNISGLGNFGLEIVGYSPLFKV